MVVKIFCQIFFLLRLILNSLLPVSEQCWRGRQHDEGGRCLGRSLAQPVLRADPLDQIAQGHVQWRCGYLQGQETLHPLWPQVQCVTTLGVNVRL